MNNELAGKMKEARDIIVKVEEYEKIMQQNGKQLSFMKKECEELKRKSRKSWFILMYFVMGLVALVVGFFPALFIGGYIIPLFTDEYLSDHIYILYAVLIGYGFVWIVYNCVFFLWTIRRKKKCKEYVNKVLCTEEGIQRDNQNVLPWCREVMKKLDFIPMEYQYGIAIDFFYKVLANGRAENLKECMNLYEEQMHRWKIEQSISNLQQMQSVTVARVNALERETKWASITADMALAAHLF